MLEFASGDQLITAIKYMLWKAKEPQEKYFWNKICIYEKYLNGVNSLFEKYLIHGNGENEVLFSLYSSPLNIPLEQCWITSQIERKLLFYCYDFFNRWEINFRGQVHFYMIGSGLMLLKILLDRCDTFWRADKNINKQNEFSVFICSSSWVHYRGVTWFSCYFITWKSVIKFIAF